MGKAQGWKVDHSLDDQESRHGSVVTTSDKSNIVEPDLSDELETPAVRKARKRSLWVAYITMFVMSIGFSIVLSGVWPYLKNIDSSMTKVGLGYVVAANPFGQMVASPLLGIWGNKAGSIRPACLATIVCFIFGNALYSCLYGINDPSTAYYIMIFSRFIVGVSSANVTLCRSYVAGATTQKERTKGLSIVAAAQALGFVVGPVIQAILTVTVKGTTGTGAFTWDKYTSAGWVAAVLGLINLVIMLPCVFQEYSIADKERDLLQKQGGGSATNQLKLPKIDILGIIGILFAFFFVLFIYVLLEALAEPFVTDMYAVDDDFAMVAVGIALAGAGLICVGGFIGTSKLAKKYDERKLLIFLGLIPEVIGTCLYLPFGDGQIVVSNCTEAETQMMMVLPNFGDFSIAEQINSVVMPDFISPLNTSSPELTRLLMSEIGAVVPPKPKHDAFYSSLLREEDEQGSHNCTLGCPKDQEWCNDVPKTSLAQLIVAFIITMTSYPVVQGLSTSIFSKMLGPQPQGLWMGILTGVGSLARVTGPIFVAYVYTKLGTYYCFGILSIGMFLSLVEVCLLYKRLVPMKVDYNREGISNEIAEDEL